MSVWSSHVAGLSLPHRYELDEASGTTLVDSGTSPSNGATSATNITHNVASLIPGDSTGKSKVSASGANIDTGTVAYDFAVGFTIYWTYKGTTGNVAGNGEIFRTLAVSHLGVQVNATDVILNSLSGVGALSDVLVARGQLLDNAAHLCVLTVINNSQKFYLDGVLKTTLTRGATISSSSQFRFARSGSGNYLSGGYDAFGFKNAVMSQADVTALYQAWTGVVAPNVPTSVAVDPDVITAAVTWSAPSGGATPDGYDVRLNGGTPVDVGNVLSYGLTGLTPGTAYNTPGVEVRAYTSSGDSSWVAASFTTDVLPAPTGLVNLGDDENTITLGWDSHAYAEGFEVRIDGGTPIDVGLSTLHMFDGLDESTLYDLEVRAYLDGFYSDWSVLEADTDGPPPPNATYTATIQIGDHSWTITESDTLDPEELIHVLDGLTLGWEINESDPWPTQPSPVESKVQLWTADVDNLPDVAIGTVMWFVLEDGDGNVFATFDGRVSQMQVRPVKRRSGVYARYDVAGVDYTVDLDEEPVTIAEEWPAEAGDARFDRIAALAATVDITFVPPSDTGSAAFEALAAGTTTIGSLIRDHLRQTVIDGDTGPVRYIVVPVVVGHVLDRFECVLLPDTVDASSLPGTFAIVGGLFTLVFPDVEANGIVSAGDVNLDTTWTRLKYRAVNRVTVTGETVAASASRPGPPVRLDLDTTLTDQATADLMADLYLPDTDEALGWVADVFEFYAHRHQEALIPAWFPDHQADPGVADAYTMPIAVVGIAESVNLAGDQAAYAGALANAALTVERRKLTVDFALRRSLIAGVGDDAASWAWAQAEFPTVDWEDIDPDLSWYETRLGKAV